MLPVSNPPNYNLIPTPISEPAFICTVHNYHLQEVWKLLKQYPECQVYWIYLYSITIYKLRSATQANHLKYTWHVAHIILKALSNKQIVSRCCYKASKDQSKSYFKILLALLYKYNQPWKESESPKIVLVHESTGYQNTNN